MNVRTMLGGLVLALGVAGTALGQTANQPQSPLVAARKQVTDAQVAVKAAQTLVDQAKLKVAATFKTTNPDYAKAEAELAKSKQGMEAAKLAAQAAVKKKPEYIAAATTKVKAQDEIRTAAATGGTADPALSTTIGAQATIMSRLESQALESDPKFLEAKAKYAEAAKAAEVFKTQLDEAYKVDPEYTTVLQTWTQAQQTLTTAQENVKNVSKSEGERMRAESKARAASRTPPK